MPVAGQNQFGVSGLEAEAVVDEKTLYQDVSFLCDSICQGRGTGTRGAVETAAYISRSFKSSGLMPMSDYYIDSFEIGNTIGRNVIGMIPGWADKYIIIASHFDHIGILDGIMYPGADSNASGTASLMALGKMFGRMIHLGKRYSQSIIFVALDGGRLSMAGSQDLWDRIAAGQLRDPRNGRLIDRRNITMFVNLDILGASFSPIHSGREDYLIMLGAGKYRNYLTAANSDYNTNLDLGFDYYGSRNFTDMFLKRIGDQKVFYEHGVPTAVFTSGITMETNKQSDTPSSLNFPVLKRRTHLIFHFLDRIIPIL